LVGTFYAKPAPDKDDYVKVGSRVNSDTIVCQVEAMKIFNTIPAKVAGTIAELCVKNGDFVEFEQVLFRVDPS
jgi:acetyl-CoA carboxylase biotin carboxyl carrier protein